MIEWVKGVCEMNDRKEEGDGGKGRERKEREEEQRKRMEGKEQEIQEWVNKLVTLMEEGRRKAKNGRKRKNGR